MDTIDIPANKPANEPNLYMDVESNFMTRQYDTSVLRLWETPIYNHTILLQSLAIDGRLTCKKR